MVSKVTSSVLTTDKCVLRMRRIIDKISSLAGDVYVHYSLPTIDGQKSGTEHHRCDVIADVCPVLPFHVDLILEPMTCSSYLTVPLSDGKRLTDTGIRCRRLASA